MLGVVIFVVFFFITKIAFALLVSNGVVTFDDPRVLLGALPWLIYATGGAIAGSVVAIPLRKLLDKHTLNNVSN